MTKRPHYSPEVRERAIRLVQEQRGAHESHWESLEKPGRFKLGTSTT